MLATAHHPLTGAPIRILRTEPQIAADNKTLLWVRADFAPSHRWRRWYPVISEPAATAVVGAEHVVAVVLAADAVVADWLPVFPTLFAASSDTLLVAPSAVVDAFAAAGLSAGDRTLLVEDLYDNYPFLGEPVVAEDAVAKVVVSLAHVLRMNRIAWSAGSAVSQPPAVRTQLAAWGAACCVSRTPTLLELPAAAATDAAIPRTWLIQQYFQHPTGRRQREIRTCLDKNLACDFLDHILLLNEAEYSELPVGNAKLQTALLGHRLTYADVLKAIRSRVPAGDFVVFGNSDIYCDASLAYLWRIRLAEQRQFLALLRWEDGESPVLFGPRDDSQDAWILAHDSVDFEIADDEFGFPFGKPGCDNAIGLLMMRRKFMVVNPAYTIRTLHIHASAVRNYDPKDILYKPQYLYIAPTPIQGAHVAHDVSSYLAPAVAVTKWQEGRLGASFSRPLLGVNDADVATVASMLRRGDADRDVAWGLSAASANTWTPSPSEAPLYRFTGPTGFFVGAAGIVSDFRSLYVGKHALWAAAWSAAKQSSLTPALHVPALIAAPCEAAWTESLGAWVLNYLPRALRIRAAAAAAGVRNAEFLVPAVENVGAFLSDCSWDSVGNITVVPYSAEGVYFSQDVWAVPPTAEHTLLTAEDVALLRRLLPDAPVLRTDRTHVAVFFVEDAEDAVCTRGWAEEVVTNLFSGRDAGGAAAWDVRYVSNTDLPLARRAALRDATWIFGAGLPLDWIWMAPAGATVMEFMSDSAPVGDHIHLAGAAGLRHIVSAVKRAPLVNQKQAALLEVGTALQKYGFLSALTATRVRTGAEKPVVVLPAGAALTGIWSHAGDTFREMVEMWGERGYVNVERSDVTPYCWWGGVGDVLLYDRPTARWWSSPPAYKMAMFGNCAPPGPGAHTLKQSVWCFWGRSPRALEDVADRHLNLRGYAERPIASLFLGKVENGVQQAARCGTDWSRVVELFSMPIDTTGAPYPYTQAQYLEKLCMARYGLCLPGFGPKCNREIEYFACGCVPIVTGGVDMRGYLVPPREGIHYLRAETPADVVRLVATTSPEKWALMSAAGRAWWSAYASAEGLFRLTWARIEQCRPYLQVGLPAHFP
jgi:hypothetical protein